MLNPSYVPPTLQDSERSSDCLGRQAGCHGFWSRRMALRMVRSLRATATRATMLGFPAARRRSRKALRTGLGGAATRAARNRAERTLLRPPAIMLLPFQWPDWRGWGGRAAGGAGFFLAGGSR